MYLEMIVRLVSLIELLSQLDWISILDHAINKGIFTSAWNKSPVNEWRNAGDSIFCAIIYQLEKKGIDVTKSRVNLKFKKSCS